MSHLDNLNGGSRFIAYRPELRNIFPDKKLSATATILLQQILHRYKPSKNSLGSKFYKFKERYTFKDGEYSVISHEAYRDGDSWCEELGFTRGEFDTALKQIAVKSNKNKYLDDLQVNPIVYYVDKTRLTWYCINEATISHLIKNLYSDSVDFSQSETPTLAKEGLSTLANTTNALYNNNEYKDNNKDNNKEVSKPKKPTYISDEESLESKITKGIDPRKEQIKATNFFKELTGANFSSPKINPYYQKWYQDFEPESITELWKYSFRQDKKGAFFYFIDAFAGSGDKKILRPRQALELEKAKSFTVGDSVNVKIVGDEENPTRYETIIIEEVTNAFIYATLDNDYRSFSYQQVIP